MIEDKLITNQELDKYLMGETLGDKAKALLNQQKETWPMLSEGYKSLTSVEVKEFEFDGFNLKVQFNPGRIKSSAAKVDSKSIKERKCFLCPENLPTEQKALPFRNDYLLLCNPFPIFPEHFTIPQIEHFPQTIYDNFTDLLELSKGISKFYTVFYNGPKCGASAPDHMHFQAGNKYFMPIDEEYAELNKTGHLEELVSEDNIVIYNSRKYLRNFLAMESDRKDILKDAFYAYYNSHQKLTGNSEEPMMNILGYFDDNKWRVLIFPRGKHRPDFYYSEGEDKFIWSPAAVDLGGVCITPVERDFKKITKDKLVEGFRQITAPNEYFEFIKKELITYYKKEAEES
jgi:hypothetical protein